MRCPRFIVLCLMKDTELENFYTPCAVLASWSCKPAGAAGLDAASLGPLAGGVGYSVGGQVAGLEGGQLSMYGPFQTLAKHRWRSWRRGGGS